MKLSLKRYNFGRWVLIGLCTVTLLFFLWMSRYEILEANFSGWIILFVIFFALLIVAILSIPPLKVGGLISRTPQGHLQVKLPLWRMIWIMLAVLGALGLLAFLIFQVLIVAEGSGLNGFDSIASFILVSSVLLHMVTQGSILLAVFWTRGKVHSTGREVPDVLDQDI